jgi:tripartite-type tricarboxylate transporter receptor subunit TctC
MWLQGHRAGDHRLSPAVVMFSQVISALEPIRSGKLKALGVANPKRNPLLPDVPTIAEQDLPGFEAVSWYALMVPAGTPKPVVDRLQDEVSKILKSPAVSGKLSQLGADVDGGTSAALAATIQRETERWAEVIRKQNIRCNDFMDLHYLNHDDVAALAMST